MADTKEIIREAESLPVEERAKLVDSLLRSLNPPDAAVDRKWVAVAKRRLEELRSGKVKAIPADVVFAEVQRLFAK
jgi:putative addiction module component (TIGR02574 family)